VNSVLWAFSPTQLEPLPARSVIFTQVGVVRAVAVVVVVVVVAGAGPVAAGYCGRVSCIVVTIAVLADPVVVAGVVVGISGTSQDTPHSLTTAMLYISTETFSAGVSRCQPCNSGFERPAGRTAASSGIPWFVLNNQHTAMRACHSTRVPPRYRMMSATRGVGGRRMCWLLVAVDSLLFA
jgi:hypothetical protein